MVIVRPESIASCPCCGCLVLARVHREAARDPVEVWDPGRAERCLVRSRLGRGDVERQGFGLTVGGPHECPPVGECALGPVGDRRKRGVP